MSQYFENDGNIKAEYRRITHYNESGELIFDTCGGVFSKDGIDDFSLVLIDCIKRYDIRGDLLDLGCGYGIIGIILAKNFRNLKLVQSDVNRTALELAEQNCKLNNVDSTVLYSDGYENIAGDFDTVVLNPPIHAGKAVVYSLFRETKNHLRQGGRFFIVMHKKHGAESALSELRTIFGSVEIIYKKKGLYVIVCG